MRLMCPRCGQEVTVGDHAGFACESCGGWLQVVPHGKAFLLKAVARELPRLADTFPAPVMSFLAGAGPQLNAGMSYDVAFENGFARIMELRYGGHFRHG